jgi:hypothetical protein
VFVRIDVSQSEPFGLKHFNLRGSLGLNLSRADPPRKQPQ